MSHRSGSCGARKDPCTLGSSIGGASEGIGDACYCTARMCAMATQAVEEAYAPRSFSHQKFAILDQIFCRTINTSKLAEYTCQDSVTGAIYHILFMIHSITDVDD